MRDCLGAGRIVFLCAPKGMGKSVLVEHECAHARKHGSHVISHSFAGLTCAQALRHIASLARDVRNAMDDGSSVLLACEDVPAGDERFVSMLAADINSIAKHGAHILVTIEPSAQTLVERVKRAEVITTQQLLVTPRELALWSPDFAERPLFEMRRLTHGIPLLVDALRSSSARMSRVADAPASSSYVRAVSWLAKESVSSALMDEERVLRMGMVLLGEGSFPDLEELGVRVDASLLEDLASEAPFFQIDQRRRTFECIPAVSETYDMSFAQIARERPSLVLAAVRHLTSEGRFARAGHLLASHCMGEEAARLVAEHPVGFLNAGQRRLVADVVSLFAQTVSESGSCLQESTLPGGVPPGGIHAAAMALACVDGNDEAIEREARLIERMYPDVAEETMVELGLLAHRRRIRKAFPAAWADDATSRLIKSASKATGGDSSVIVASLRVHLRAQALIIGGRAHEAFRLMLVGGVPCDGTSLVSSLLADDFWIARAITGDPAGPADERAQAAARDFYAASGFDEQSRDERVFASMLDVISGVSKEFGEADRAILRASSRHDTLDRAILLLVAAISDLRCASPTRALIRANAAKTDATSAGATWLSQVAELLRVLAQVSLGERPSTEGLSTLAEGGGERAVGILSRLVCAASAQDEGLLEALHASALDMTRTPELLALLDVACGCCGTTSDDVRKALPQAWRSDLEAYRRRRGLSENPRDDGLATGGAAAVVLGAERPRLLEIDLLGGFTVRLGGVILPNDAWKRKKAAVLLAMLAASKNHACRRFNLVEALWPEDDYERGRSCLYSTLSSLRKTLGQSKEENRYILGGGGILQLDSNCVSCDVDKFETFARDTLLRGGDARWTLERCRQVEEMYQGDLYLPFYDVTGLFRDRRASLRKLYSDAMVAGAEAALDLGMAREALWFAHDAEEPGTLREDVATCLVRALKGTGRAREAESVYSSFAARVIDETGQPPSMKMRSLYAALGAGHEPIGTRRLELGGVREDSLEEGRGAGENGWEEGYGDEDSLEVAQG